MKRLVIVVIVLAFIGDLIYKNIYEKKPNPNNAVIKPRKQGVNSTQTRLNITTRTHFINYEDNNEDEEEFDEIIAKVNPTINMTIIYDPKLYKDTLTNITSLLQGNYTNMLITSEEFEIDFKYYITSKVLFGTQIGMSLFFMAFNSIKSYLPLPDKLLNFISTTKMFLGGGSFFLHQYAIKKCSQSNAFEVYVMDKLIYSALTALKAPTYEEIVQQLTNMHIYKN